MKKPIRFSPEVLERAVRMVLESQDQHDSQWAAIESIAGKIGCTTETLRRWVRQQERDAGQRDGVTTVEAKRIKDLEREVREIFLGVDEPERLLRVLNLPGDPAA
jgi:transposase